MVFFPFTSFSAFDLIKCLQPSFVVSHLFPRHVLAMEQTCRYLLYQLLLRFLVLLTVLFLTLNEQAAAPARWMRKSTKSTYSYRFYCKTRPKTASRRFPRLYSPFRLRLQVWNRLLAASQPALPPWKQMQLPPQGAPARQDVGT